MGILGSVVEIIKNAISFLAALFVRLVYWVKDLLNVSDEIALYIGYGVVALIGLILILLIVLLCVGGKKRKAKRKAKKEAKAQVKENTTEEVAPVEETTPVEEVKEETTVVEEEPKAEEVTAVEEAKVSEVEPVVEEPVPVVEKTPAVEEKVEEVAPVEEVKEEAVVETKTTRIAIGKYEVFPVNDVYLYRLKASNGEIMVTSEIYKSAKGAVSAIETVKKNVENGTLQVYEDKHGLWQFKLFAANKRLIVTSANYTSEASCTNAANSFKRFATISPVVILEEDSEHLMEEIKLEALADKKGGKLTINAVGGEYDFKLLASNGVVLCSSSDYKTKTAITGGINSVKEAIKNGKFFVVKDKRGTFQFKLYSTLGRCVLVGEAYKTKAQAISAANSVASFINLATTIDKTEVVAQ